MGTKKNPPTEQIILPPKGPKPPKPPKPGPKKGSKKK